MLDYRTLNVGDEVSAAWDQPGINGGVNQHWLGFHVVTSVGMQKVTARSKALGDLREFEITSERLLCQHYLETVEERAQIHRDRAERSRLEQDIWDAWRMVNNALEDMDLPGMKRAVADLGQAVEALSEFG